MAAAKRALLRIGGFQPFTTVDYPGALAAVIFCQGCPLRCVYCHNPDLLPARAPPRIQWRDIYDHLAKRRGLLDAAVFSGGEPLMQSGLAEAMRAVKELGYRIGLHTSGAAPARLGAVLHLVDWVGFDVKAPFGAYEKITGVAEAGARARLSLEMLVRAKTAMEARATVWPDMMDALFVERIISDVKALGVDNIVLQEARDPVSKAPRGIDEIVGAVSKNKPGQDAPEFKIRRAA